MGLEVSVDSRIATIKSIWHMFKIQAVGSFARAFFKQSIELQIPRSLALREGRHRLRLEIRELTGYRAAVDGVAEG
jgi:hypothetical protein